MKNTFAKKFTVCALAGVLGAAFIGCGDDGSSSPKGTGLPVEVADMEELETYECGMDVIGVKVYVADLELNYECDGEKWFKSYDQTKPSSSSAKSSSSIRADGEGDDGDDENSPDSEKGSSSSVTPSDVEGSSKTAWDYLNPDINYGEFTDERDGQIYKTVTIAPAGTGYSEVWMAENLNFETENSWCGGGIETTEGDCSVYGRLYTWAAAVGRAEDECGIDHACNLGEGDIRGACPKGWHLPSQSEWEALIVAVDGSITEYTSSNTAGTKLKSATRGSWVSYSGITNEDAFGFSALPAGYRNYGIENYNYWGKGTYFWSSTEETIYYAYVMGLDYRNDGALLTYDRNHKNYGDSVRCLKD